MRKLCVVFLFTALSSLVVLPSFSTPARAAPVEMYYNVAPDNGTYLYSFTMIQEQAGLYSLGWLIPADSGPTCGGGAGLTSPTLVGPAPGPWTSLSASTGGHTGPTFAPVLTEWTPSGVGDSITWQFRATNLIPAGSPFFWTNLSGASLFNCVQILELCGNGSLEFREVCDDGNTANGDGCSSLCQFEYCGNSVVDPSEVCDDGNTVSGDGCSATCASDETCGNGVLDTGESCDDGNIATGDGCSATCASEFCGNGAVDPGESCDDGNTDAGDGCSADCRSDEVCGNGVVDSVLGEACDDGNTADGDGCQGNCASPDCGDGIVDSGEACDDGNTASGDGCSGTCMSDETCGNGVFDMVASESCDDGNTTDGDGCSALCEFEPSSDGCGCRVGAARTGPKSGASVLLLFGCLVLLRRRRRLI